MLKSKVGAGGSMDTLVGEGTVVEGKMISSSGIRIEGQVTGDIECAGDVTVGEGSMLKSNVVADNVTVAGTLYGNVTTKGRLVITPTGQLIGSIDVHSFTLMEGGIFQGTSKMEPRTTENQLQTKREQKQIKQKSDAAAAAN